MENKDELIYIKRILEGETKLFSYFLQRYSNSVFSMIVRIVQSREDAEELLERGKTYYKKRVSSAQPASPEPEA